ncbi:hypothetical protein [Microcoleus sp.]|uniref:hypothetical protein n=1 Tax=Microcoleus sp. TaxID=44472 RepID=UPI003525CA8B
MEVRTLIRSHTLSEKSIVLDNTTQWSGSRAQIFPATFSITALVRSPVPATSSKIQGTNFFAESH